LPDARRSGASGAGVSGAGASGLDLDTVDKLLTTTRAVRKRLDLTRPVALDVVLECLDLALQAPTGSNQQTWRWIVITDAETRASLADLYRGLPADRPPTRLGSVPPPEEQQARVTDSAGYLMEHLHEVPLLVVPCVEDVGGAAGWAPSIYPAVWSFMLALRSRGLGSVLTTVHLYRSAEADALLGVPDGFVQSCLLPVAYFTGDDFRPADRRPVEEVTYVDHWGRHPADRRQDR
jgi:nitroreductase